MNRWDSKRKLLHFNQKGAKCVASFWPKPWAARLERAASGDKAWRHFRPPIALEDADYGHPDPRRSAVRLSRIEASTPERLRQVLTAGARIPLSHWLDRRAIASAARMVPKGVRELIVEKYGGQDRKKGRQWAMLSFMARVPFGESVARSSPALAMLLANSWVVRGKKAVARPLRSARSLVKAPRAAVLKWLRIHASAKNILHKIDMRKTELIHLVYLNDALRDRRHGPSVLRKLSHMPPGSITGPVIRAMDPAVEPHAGHHFLLALSKMPRTEAHDTIQLLRDTLGLAQQARPAGVQGLVFDSPGHMLRAHNHYLTEARRRNRIGPEFSGGIDPATIHLPPPPLPTFRRPGEAGRPGIWVEPLETAEAVKTWSECQSNCIYHGPYLEMVRRSGGRVYLYRILEPSPATLLVERGPKGFRKSALRGMNNRPVSPETEAAVRTFLRETRKAQASAEETQEEEAWAGDEGEAEELEVVGEPA